MELENANLDSDYKPTDNEEYMNEKQLAYFKGKLMDWKNELINQSQETLYNLKTESRDVSDEAERASRESDNILELRTRDRYRKLLSKIDSALRRIGDGTYGYCEETGEEIGLRRLEARPTATLTVDAQERREMFQKQFRDVGSVYGLLVLPLNRELPLIFLISRGLLKTKTHHPHNSWNLGNNSTTP